MKFALGWEGWEALYPLCSVGWVEALPSGCYGTEVQGEPSPLGLWVDGLNTVDLQGPCCDPETLPCMEGLGRESTR